jgi:hypothetical protein
MCLLTAGFYNFYWFYKQLSVIYDKKIFKTIGSLFYSGKLFKTIAKATQKDTSSDNLGVVQFLIFVYTILCALFWFGICGGYTFLLVVNNSDLDSGNIALIGYMITIFMGALISLPLASMQRRINEKNASEEKILKLSITPMDILLIIIVFIITAPFFQIDLAVKLPATN